MTITVTSHGVQTKSSSSTDVVFPSFTPAAGSMLLLIAGGGGTLTINGITGHTGGAAWTQVKDIPGWSTANRDFKAWACFVGGSPSASAVTIDINYVDTGVFELFELSGVDTSGTVTNAFGVDGSEYGYDLEPWTATLAAFSAATNMTFCVGIQVDATPTFTWDGNLTTGTLRQLGNWAQQCAWVDSEDNTVAFNSENFKNGFIWATEIKAASGSYTLVAAQGSYSLTGQAAGLRASRSLTAAQGSYSLNGQAATLRKSYPLVAAQGSYSLTGQPAGLAVARVITAAQGSYALTGIAANLVYGKTLAAEQGTYSLSGQAAGVRLARVMAASQGSYTLSGQPAGLRATRTLTAAQGAYTLSGQTANLFAARRLTAAQGAYTLTGIAAGLIYSGSGPVLIAGMGGYSLTGQAAALRRSAVLTAAQGAYALDGQPAGLVYGKRMAADAGGYTITGQAATLRTARVLAAATGFYTLDGQPANLVHSGLPFEPEAESATGGWAHYFRAEQAALRRKHLRALAEEAEEASEREALAEALETALIADGTATQGDVDRLRLDQIAALYTDRTLLDRRAQRALAYAERSRTELATRLALRELQRQQEDEELAVVLVLAID